MPTKRPPLTASLAKQTAASVKPDRPNKPEKPVKPAKKSWWQNPFSRKPRAKTAGARTPPNSFEIPSAQPSASAGSDRSISGERTIVSSQLSQQYSQQYSQHSQHRQSSHAYQEPLTMAAPTQSMPFSRREIVPAIKQQEQKQEQLKASALNNKAKKTGTKKFSKIKHAPYAALFSWSKISGLLLPLSVVAVAVLVIATTYYKRFYEAEFESVKQRYSQTSQTRNLGEVSLPEIAPLANRYSRWVQGGFLGSPNILDWDGALSKVQRHFGWTDLTWSFLNEETSENNLAPLTITTMRLLINTEHTSELFNIQQLLSAYVGNDGPLIYIRDCHPVRESTTLTECYIDWLTAKPPGESADVTGNVVANTNNPGNMDANIPSSSTTSAATSTAEPSSVSDPLLTPSAIHISPTAKSSNVSTTVPNTTVTTISITPAQAAKSTQPPKVSEHDHSGGSRKRN